MKKYDVLIDRVQSVPFIVDAENEEEAEEKALILSYDYNWNDAPVLCNEVTDTQVVNEEDVL
jgi:hypothetical protein